MIFCNVKCLTLTKHFTSSTLNQYNILSRCVVWPLHRACQNTLLYIDNNYHIVICADEMSGPDHSGINSQFSTHRSMHFILTLSSQKAS